MNEESGFATVSFMDCLTSALGAFLLIMLLMSMLALQGLRSAPPSREGVYIEVMLEDPGQPYDLATEVIGSSHWNRDERHGMTERGVGLSINPEGGAVEAVFALEPSRSLAQVRHLVRDPQFGLLVDPATYGATGPDDLAAEVKPFRRWMELLRGDGTLPANAAAEFREACRGWYAHIMAHRGTNKLSPLALSRAERFAVAADALLADRAGPPSSGPVRVRWRLMGLSAQSAATSRRGRLELAPGRDRLQFARGSATADWRVEKVGAIPARAGAEGK